MANLITPKQKKIVEVEYLTRLLSAVLLLAAIFGLFLLAYVIPYYLSVAKNDIVVSAQFQEVLNVENKENVGESAARIVTRTLDEMKSVELYDSKTSVVSATLLKIIANRNTNIRIARLSFSTIEKNHGWFVVNGIAKNRASLVSFIEALKTESDFQTVESPISDFAKDVEITFTINIKTSL